MDIEKIEKEYKNFFYKGLLILGIGVALMLVSPFIWTRNSGILDFSATGQIGDTVGGLTAPVVGLIGAALVFFSFMEQWKANKIQMDTILTSEKEKLMDERATLLWKLHDEIKTDMRSPRMLDFYSAASRNKDLEPISQNELTILLGPIISNFKYLLLTFLGYSSKDIKADYVALFRNKFILLNEEIKMLFGKLGDNSEGKKFLMDDYYMIQQRILMIEKITLENFVSGKK